MSLFLFFSKTLAETLGFKCSWSKSKVFVLTIYKKGRPQRLDLLVWRAGHGLRVYNDQSELWQPHLETALRRAHGSRTCMEERQTDHPGIVLNLAVIKNCPPGNTEPENSRAMKLAELISGVGFPERECWRVRLAQSRWADVFLLFTRALPGVLKLDFSVIQ